jgi:hypothetical protein
LFSHTSQFYGSLDRLDSQIKIITGSLERIALSCTSGDPAEMYGHSYEAADISELHKSDSGAFVGTSYQIKILQNLLCIVHCPSIEFIALVLTKRRTWFWSSQSVKLRNVMAGCSSCTNSRVEHHVCHRHGNVLASVRPGCCMFGVTRQKHCRPLSATRVHGLDPSMTQDIIIGGSIIMSVGAALYLGLQKEPEVCPSCNGSGGVICFACEGTGLMDSEKVSPEIEAAARRESLGRNRKKNECRACKGVGRLLCKRCGGSGYLM